MAVNFTAADRIGGIGGYIGGISALLNGGILGGMGGQVCGDNMPISRYEASMMNQLSEKDSKISLLEADKYTDQKIVEAYKDLAGQISALSEKVQHNKDEQYGINLNQAVLNGTTGAAISCIQGQIAQLQGLTKVVVPNSSVCPGWGDVTVSIPTTTAAG